ncbi:MAG: hypothetical protein H6813_06470 [Phycisphaeraceae bacterium]|nr:hypothetical protein [Phycisphaeraceae bacterium]MCB9848116.1 hypothetical protein [Phycisphaeraceae bacterium]
MLMDKDSWDLCRLTRAAAVTTLGAVLTIGAGHALASDDDECDNRPNCEIVGLVGEGMDAYVEIECANDSDTGMICVYVDGTCPDSDRLRVRLKRGSNTVETKYVTDEGNPVEVCFEVNLCDREDGYRSENWKIEVKDEDGSDRSEECRFDIIVRKGCDKLPACYFGGHQCDSGPEDVRTEYMMAMYQVKTGDILPELELCARSHCDDYNISRVELFARPPFMDPIGATKGPHMVCISTRANDVVEGGFAEGTYWAKFKCSDVTAGTYRIIKVGFVYTDPMEEDCTDPPTCEVMEGTDISVDAGSSTTITVCADSPCGHCGATQLATDIPGFVSVSDTGENCVGYSIAPGMDDAGDYTATFTATDCEGRTTDCVVNIHVGAPAPIVTCTEEEAQSPNDTFADATVVNAGDCTDTHGTILFGVLDTPVFMNGDVDYFRVTGLQPGVSYEATIVAGLNTDNVFTDTMLGWFVAEGVAVAVDDNSGPMRGYSKIAFTADENGVATLAVAGHGDDNFDGHMASGMPYDEFGRGGYMLSIRTENAGGNEMPIERQADLNGDGVVNTSDLGILIGLFGATN